MERQSRKLGKGNIWVRFHFHNLSRSETSHGHLVEVVGSATVREPAPLVLLEINGINSVVHHTFLDVLSVLHMHHAHQGMKRFHPLIFVEVLYGIEKNLLHILFVLSRLSFSSIRIVGSIDDGDLLVGNLCKITIPFEISCIFSVRLANREKHFLLEAGSGVVQ